MIRECSLNCLFRVLSRQNPLAQIEEERREHHAKLIKMEKEMEEVFERKVREKKQKLQDSEEDLEKRHRESKVSAIDYFYRVTVHI